MVRVIGDIGEIGEHPNAGAISSTRCQVMKGDPTVTVHKF